LLAEFISEITLTNSTWALLNLQICVIVNASHYFTFRYTEKKSLVKLNSRIEFYYTSAYLQPRMGLGLHKILNSFIHPYLVRKLSHLYYYESFRKIFTLYFPTFLINPLTSLLYLPIISFYTLYPLFSLSYIYF